MQQFPALPVDGTIDVTTSNAAQRRGSHGAFRYFGKLAPDVTGRVLDLAYQTWGGKGSPRVVDVMCGSGTTLIEAADRGWPSIGIDVNPVALLYARAKTEAVDSSAFGTYLEEVLAATELDPPSGASDPFAPIRNANRWFPGATRKAVTGFAHALSGIPEGPERRLLEAVLLSRLRRWSNASARTGRLFFDAGTAMADPRADFRVAAMEALTIVPRRDLNTNVRRGDARNTGLQGASADLVFCHPPYFALYRYSSDVLRFELSVGGYSRTEVARSEIREGWKSGDPDNLLDYLADMKAVFDEAHRLLAPGGVFALVVANSTLGDLQLPVVDGLVEQARLAGMLPLAHFARPALFGSAKYHRSARADKVVQRDHVVMFGLLESSQHEAQATPDDQRLPILGRDVGDPVLAGDRQVS